MCNGGTHVRVDIAAQLGGHPRELWNAWTHIKESDDANFGLDRLKNSAVEPKEKEDVSFCLARLHMGLEIRK